jgi:hypothetical protein
MAGISPLAGPEKRRRRLTPWRVAGIALLVVALLAVGGVFLARSLGGKSSASSTTTATTTATVNPIGPLVVSPAALAGFAAALGRPIYWAGPASGYTYELTETSTGNVYVRYLPSGVRAGDKRATFRVVGTYPYTGALAALEAVPKAHRDRLPGGGIIVSTAADPKSVHIAYPGVDYQIEVYDPTPGRAREIALSGRIQPVR